MNTSTDDANTPGDDLPPTIYSEREFFVRSIIFGLISFTLTLWLTDATGWQAWAVATGSLIACTGISTVQASFIENGILLLIHVVILIGLWTTDYFGFHWSVLLAGTIGALNGMGARESRNRQQYRTVYGEEAYKEKYSDG